MKESYIKKVKNAFKPLSIINPLLTNTNTIFEKKNIIEKNNKINKQNLKAKFEIIINKYENIFDKDKLELSIINLKKVNDNLKSKSKSKK